MSTKKAIHIIVSILMAITIMLGSGQQALAQPNNSSSAAPASMPMSPTDESKVPHSFGPNPNWANSPMTLPDVIVTINGDGTGATATASIDAAGGVTGFTITSPGSGYTTATADITGSGTGATATPVISTTSVVTAIQVTAAGSGYTAPVVAISGGGATTDATATAYGGVDAVTLTDPGAGYTMPTVDFDFPDDPNGVQASGHVVCLEANCAASTVGGTVTITGVVVDNPGSGYSKAPNVVIRDGTLYAPINKNLAAAQAAREQAMGNSAFSPAGITPAAVTTNATATATLSILSVTLNTFGSGYTSAPAVNITDTAPGIGTGAAATAVTDGGAITSITLGTAGSGYFTQGGIKKFVDGLPQLCIPDVNLGQTFADCASNNLGQHIPIAIPDTTTFPGADYYVIALVQHRERMSTSLPATGTLLREYVQLETSAPEVKAVSKSVALQTSLLNGTSTPTLMPDGTPAVAVDEPHYLGPIIVASKDRPVRVTFYNLLPTGSDGDFYLPVDSTMMGSGMGPMGMAEPMDQGTVTDMVRNPMCTESPKDTMNCFADNRATVHLHGGISPWISDGTPHQWITPANENTPWPEGVDVKPVPDMYNIPGVPDCASATDGCMNFYYTNQQSARLLFYHDHSWGITRLNVYAGEAAGYIITDATEQKLFGPTGTFSDLGEGTPLIIQDRTFVPQASQLYNQYDANGNVISYGQDPTWDETRWGTYGDFWYHHVYMSAQNPGDPSGMSAYGRWMYGPWFWPPAGTAKYQPIANPYFDPKCDLNNPATWQYQVDPFCEPAQIPGTPNISVGMEQFNDTPLVNGTAYPTTTVDPKSYRFRILNAANDRFWNLQWYIADATTASTALNANGDVIGGTEVALKASEVAAAQTDPAGVFPTPDLALSPAGPDWIQIGNESGFLPAPVVVDGQQVITWITDPTRFDVGNVDQHSLVVAPAERADVIVDFSQFAGQTLILYNDSPAAYPARVPSYDYYTGYPDQSPNGPSAILPGYGPNTRTVMQVKVAAARSDGQPITAFNLAGLKNAFTHKADGSGVFESGQNPIIVGQAAYNSAYGKNFAAAGDCTDPNGINKCDGFARINQQGGDLFRFDTLNGKQLSIKLEPKALHDEMNAASFDEFGRMTANLGLEAVPANPAAQNIILYPFVNPPTELIDATNLPVAQKDVKVTAISSASDGTQIWKLTHNGVDTHPLHFHLFDVQVLNRVTWDNIIIPPDANELGWKDTVRISPLEDTIVVVRPVLPSVPFELPNSVRPLNPMMPLGDTSMFNNTDAAGNPVTGANVITNQLVNFGLEYMVHCHILSHEEMDMMRPITVAVPPNKPDGLSYTVSGTGNKARLTLSWNDNSINETAFLVQKSLDGITWVDVGTSPSPLDQPNTHGSRSLTDPATYSGNLVYGYRVVALNTIGYGGAFMSLTAQSISDMLPAGSPPAAPTNLVAAVQLGANVRLTWTDNALNESGFAILRSANGGAFVQIATAPARTNTGSVTFTDTTVAPSTAYVYQVAAVNMAGTSAFITSGSVTTQAAPAAPGVLTAVLSGTSRVSLQWSYGTPNPGGFLIQWSTTADFAAIAGQSANLSGASRSYLTPTLARRTTYYFRVLALDLGSASVPTVAASPVTTQDVEAPQVSLFLPMIVH